MRFDASMFWHHTEGDLPWFQQVDHSRQWCKALEAQGFTGAWSSEHHFGAGSGGSPPNALMTSLDIANHTTTLRVGQAPYHAMDRHPLMVAEDASLVDHMSLGRLDFGVGRGIDERWGIQFVPFADRRDAEQNRALLAEVMDIVVKSWTEEAFSYKGRFYTIPLPGWHEPNPRYKLEPPLYKPDGELIAVTVRPKPFQKPHPPVWVMVDSKESYEFAGSRGYGVIGSSRAPEEIRERFMVYKEAASKFHGRELELGENCGLQFTTYCARTMEEADADTSHDPNPRRGGVNRNVVGTPDMIIETIEKFREVANLQMYQYRPSIWGLSFEQSMRSLELFATKVMPRFLKPADQNAGGSRAKALAS